MDQGALPPTPANPAQTNPTPPSLEWRLQVAGGNVAAITSDAEFPVIGQIGGTGDDAWNMMQGAGNAVSAAIGGAPAGSVVYFGAGYRGNQNAIPGPLNNTDFIVVIGQSGFGGMGF
jgi:hypothetical protein